MVILHRQKPVSPDDQVIHDLDIQQLPGPDHFLGHGDIFRAGSRITARVIMHNDQCGCIFPNGSLEHFPDPDRRGIQRSPVQAGRSRSGDNVCPVTLCAILPVPGCSSQISTNAAASSGLSMAGFCSPVSAVMRRAISMAARIWAALAGPIPGSSHKASKPALYIPEKL